MSVMKSRYYIIPIFVPHEGCPHNCVFCNQDSITGQKDIVTYESVLKTAKDFLATMTKEDKIVEISFFGGTFTAIKEEKQKELLKAAKKLKEQGYVNYIRLSTRPDYINNYILNYLKDYGVDIIELGVQSLDKEVLTLSGRGHSDEDVYKASRLIKEYGFRLGLQMMLGLPGDNYQKDIETASKIIELSPEMVRIYPALVIKGTPMEKMYLRGIYKPYGLMEAIDVSSRIYSMFLRAKINVIRIGLQNTEEISPCHDLVAGPYHPAFREMVQSNLLCNIIFKEAKDYDIIKIVLNPSYISKLYAGRKYYFNILNEKLHGKIQVIQDNEVRTEYVRVITKDFNKDIWICD